MFSRRQPQTIPNDKKALQTRLPQKDGSGCMFLDLRSPPSNHLEKLYGDRKGQNSIKINDQWRICFVWDGNDAYNVEIADYD